MTLSPGQKVQPKRSTRMSPGRFNAVCSSILRERAPRPPLFIGQSTWMSRMGSNPKRFGMRSCPKLTLVRSGRTQTLCSRSSPSTKRFIPPSPNSRALNYHVRAFSHTLAPIRPLRASRLQVLLLVALLLAGCAGPRATQIAVPAPPQQDRIGGAGGGGGGGGGSDLTEPDTYARLHQTHENMRMSCSVARASWHWRRVCRMRYGWSALKRKLLGRWEPRRAFAAGVTALKVAC